MTADQTLARIWQVVERWRRLDNITTVNAMDAVRAIVDEHARRHRIAASEGACSGSASSSAPSSEASSSTSAGASSCSGPLGADLAARLKACEEQIAEIVRNIPPTVRGVGRISAEVFTKVAADCERFRAALVRIYKRGRGGAAYIAWCALEGKP